jgi:hypothetical protein
MVLCGHVEDNTPVYTVHPNPIPDQETLFVISEWLLIRTTDQFHVVKELKSDVHTTLPLITLLFTNAAGAVRYEWDRRFERTRELREQINRLENEMCQLVDLLGSFS